MSTAARSVLLVDDELMLLDMLAMACTASGFAAVKAATGAEALQQIDAHPEIGLVLTDIGLTREMDGFALAAEIAARRPGLPLIFFSGHGEQAARPPGFADAKVLGKPVPLAVLRGEISAALGT
ncbi:response regulator [Poseidonocella sp. HB161398]|uniref:response regulator n=1 Tax=Poseidonocella sp. HB161398 TaxID=2320855 RepID=UPI001107D01E|nr:response regulator [Poseidonocella sp. HB161398]